jgi:hypothetical protein
LTAAAISFLPTWCQAMWCNNTSICKYPSRELNRGGRPQTGIAPMPIFQGAVQKNAMFIEAQVCYYKKDYQL